MSKRYLLVARTYRQAVNHQKEFLQNVAPPAVRIVLKDADLTGIAPGEDWEIIVLPGVEVVTMPRLRVFKSLCKSARSSSGPAVDPGEASAGTKRRKW